MKKFLGIFFVLFIPVAGICAITYYSDTEQKYYFGPDAVKSTLEQFVDKEETRIACAELYTSLMNQENGQVSVTDLFAVCRKAGFNTYRKDGFDKCREFVNGLLISTETGDIDEMMSGFCPGPDEKGNNPNALKSITEKTQIGDFCSSTNIYSGEVVFRKGYNCTCMAWACNPGYEFKGGACVTIVADGQGNCLRREYPMTDENRYVAQAVEFCGKKAAENKCKYNAVNVMKSTKKVICNPNQTEIDDVKAEMLLNQEKKVAGLKYYAVCQNGVKVPSGAHAHCVEKVFNWVNVGMVEGDGLAKLYAKEKDGKTIYCSTNPPRGYLNDDYLQCATMDGKDFYEFQFDDLSESTDKIGRAVSAYFYGSIHDKLEGVVKGLSIIYGGQVANMYSLSGSCQSSTNKKIVNAARNFGLVATNTSNGKNCKFSYNTIEDEGKLATIDGIDNYVFYHEIQIQGSDATRLKLEKYIRDLGIKVTSFECDTGYGKIAKKSILGLKEKDDVWHCNLNGQPIDFVFDDTSEAVKTTQEAGEAGIMCIISQGIYANKKCHGLDQVQCTQVDAKLKSENPKSSGTKWQNGQCVLLDVQEQNRLDNGIQIGLSVIALADCATVIVGNAQGVMGCTLAVVEITGLTTELTTGAAMQQRADDFIRIAVACNNRSCAKNTLKTMAGKALTVQDALKSASTANQIDVQLARLIEYLEPEDLQSEVSANDWDDIVRQLGGDPNDTAGRALKVANKIGFIAQFASLGASALRLTGRAIAKIASKSAAKTAASGTKALAIVGTHADDAARAADNTADAARGASTGAKAAGQADDAARGASQAANTTNDIVYDAAYFSKNTSGSDDVFRATNDIVQVNRQNMPAVVIRDLMRKAKQYGFECTDCGGDILKFSKSVDNASDATRAANNAADAARAGAKADEVADAAKTTEKVDDAAKAASKADDIADAAKVASKADDAARVEKEATEAMSFVDAGRLRNGNLNAEELNQLRKHYPDLSDAELQNKAKAISKELDAQRMLHGGFTDAELKLTENLERAANGGLTSAEQAAVKYKNALKLGSEQVDLSGGWVYISKSGYTDDMFDAAGLKFHLNVAPDDLDKAAPIIQRIVSKYDIPQWKFSQAASDLVGTAQEGKQFTLYMGKNISQNETLLKQLANEIDQTLSANGIRAGRVGDNLATGDRLVPGSRFVHYRYDQVDDMGNIISEYNNSYKFVAPKTGDVLRKSDNIANAAKTTEKADDVARATSGVVRRIDEVFPDNIQFDNAGFYMSKTPLSESDAVSIAEQMNKSDDIIAQAVPIEGTAGGKFKVVSINKKDAATLGAYLDNGVLVRNIDNSSFLRNIEMYKGKEITKIGNTPAFIEDVGSIDGRGIVTIRVGEKKIPFYVSSGQAGKMSVPTGKWEVFWGIGDKNWFNKGTSADILNHYGSSELRQIASALDAKLGDPRNVEIVLSSQLRQGVYHGQGNIARAELGSISHEQINSGLKYKPVADAYGNMTNKNNNVADITSYLRRLH